MKRIIMFILILVAIGLSNTAFASPDSATVHSRNDGGTSYQDGVSYFFETGIYEFSVLDGAWNRSASQSGQWLWNVNIFQPSTSTEQVLGNSMLFASASSALDYHSQFTSPISFTVSAPGGENLWFYINDSYEINNVGSVTVGVSVVPEPLSSMLFIAGGVIFAGRSFLRRKK